MLKYWADRAIECMTSFVYTRPFDSSLKILNLSQKMFLCQNEVRGIPYCFGENIDLLDFGFFVWAACFGSLECRKSIRRPLEALLKRGGVTLLRGKCTNSAFDLALVEKGEGLRGWGGC